jgi:acid phosphatase (class A)
MLSRRHLLGLSLSTLLALAGCTTASQSERAPSAAHYIDPGTLVLQRVVPPPPSDSSAETRAELDEMLRIQAERSPTTSARAKDDAAVSVFRFADAVGSDRFTKKNLPLTTALFDRLLEDEGLVMTPAKDAFARPRPFVLEERLQPLLDKPKSSAYPSGHSTWAYSAGLVLADMLPERRAEIMTRVREYAYNRVVVGLHYPSDIEAGAMSGAALAAALFSSFKFRADQAAAAQELREVLGLPPLAR